MINASADLDQQIRELRVEPTYRRRLRVLLGHCRRSLPSVDEALIRRAFEVAYWAHRDDRRASGELYISHPLEVAVTAARDVAFDDRSVAAALLHDTVEDTDLSLGLIEAEFGPEMAQIVDGVTKIDHVFETREVGRAENVRKLMLSMASDVRVILVKFADRLHNMRTLDSLPTAKRRRIASETLDLYAPLAHRFGLNSVKTEFEDLALKQLEPEAYQDIVDGLKAKKRQRQRAVQTFIDPIRERLDESDLSFEITGRAKSIYSIWRKMRKQEKGLDEIYDLHAIRIILDSEGRQGKEECWRVYSIITDLYQPIPERFRDFISLPKSNGYQSLHTTVVGPDGRRYEVQVRTREMHEIAERGVAAHYKYKEHAGDPRGGDGAAPAAPATAGPAPNARSADARLDRMYAWVRDLLESPQPDRAGDFVKELREQFYDEEVYVFSPKGDLLTLPHDATPVDFAFQIHTQVGFHCIGAKVNGKMVPLSHRLQSGDQVEVLTSKKQTPNPDWLQFVVTHKAKTRIRHWANEKRRKTVEQGREVLGKKLKKRKLEVSETDVERLAHKLRFPNAQQLFFEIGAGLFDPDEFVRTLSKPEAENDEALPHAGATAEAAQFRVHHAAEEARESGRPELTIDGETHAGLAVEYATCCRPLPGDEVFGFVSRAGVIKIHRTSCKNAPQLLLDQADRTVPVDWSRQRGVQFVTGLRIVGEDRVGVVSDLTSVISKSLKTNIRSIQIESEDGMFEGTLALYVEDLGHLRNLIQRLGRVDGIYGVYRLEE
jgi:RelA/SpoT family (p)ppGpp synthetase